MGSYAKRKPGLNEGQDCCPCLTLHIPLFLYVQLGVYKLILKNKVFGVLHRCGAPQVVLFSPFPAEFPSGAQRLAKSAYLPWLLRSTREGAQGGAPSAIQVDAGGLTEMVQTSCLEVLLVFCINQVIQPLFSTKSSYYTILS